MLQNRASQKICFPYHGTNFIQQNNMQVKKIFLISFILLAGWSQLLAQKEKSSSYEKYGNVLNIGVGVGYYGSYYGNMPVLQVNYEFDVAKDFTLAPFIGIYTYRYDNYWKGPKKGYRNYYYRETVIPIGIKGSYYLDDIFDAGPKWDFYGAGSIGFAFRTVTWENGYEGDRNLSHSRLFLDLHIGTEYHINKRVGLFLDLSTGASTIGLAFHPK